MKVARYELVRVIGKLKSIVQKKEQTPALAGILVNDGYLIASNTEITMQVKLEASKGEHFIIPMKAFELIKGLPEGFVEIIADKKNFVTISTDTIKNKYQSYPADQFIYSEINIEADRNVTLPGKELMEAIRHVEYAADTRNANKMLGGIYIDGSDGNVNVVALDGHVLAWDRVRATGNGNVEMIVPKTAALKILEMGIMDDVEVSYNKCNAIFRTDEYAILSRLIDGKYFSYSAMFKDAPFCTIVARKELVDAMTRAKLCTDENSPTVFEIQEDVMNIIVQDKVTNYNEKVVLQMKIEEPVKIGFDSRLVLETIKAFTCDNITLNFTNASMPMQIEAEDSDMKALVLPIKLRG